MPLNSTLSDLANAVRNLDATQSLTEPVGWITETTASGLRVAGLSQFIALGSLVKIPSGRKSILAEVIRVEKHSAVVRAYTNETNLKLGMKVLPGGNIQIRPSSAMNGRMLDSLANSIDDGPPLLLGEEAVQVYNQPPHPMKRQLIKTAVKTGIKVCDIFTPICVGQRIGIFAGSGVGKSTMLSMLGRAASFDKVVMVLVGERGREVREFAESELGQDKERLISVVATSDESALMRRLAPQTGMRIAEFFRDKGENVLFIMDSITRYAHACRDVALAAGEAPVARGYPPSVFTQLPMLLERAGPGLQGSGSITGVFSVLIEGDDHNDPIADNIRGVLDGHIVLKRNIAEQGRYPAVDPLASISRLAELCWTADQRKLVLLLRNMIAQFEDSRDLRAMGGYQLGADSELDRAVVIVPKLYEALKQSTPIENSIDPFADLATYLTETKRK